MKIVTHHRSPHLELQSYACRDSNRAPEHVEAAREQELIFVRRGAFKLVTRRGERVVTPNEVLLLPAGATYSVAHPVSGGDDCTIDAFRGRIPRERIHAALAPAALFREHIAVFESVARGKASPLETEERLATIVSSALGFFGPTDDTLRCDMKHVRRAQEIIAAHFVEDLPLATIGELCETSPFHLSRLFRRVTGTSMHRYQTTLRLRHAARELLRGAGDITALALDTGFSSHSHFTSAFRREFGVPPALFRAHVKR